MYIYICDIMVIYRTLSQTSLCYKVGRTALFSHFVDEETDELLLQKATQRPGFNSCSSI